MAFFHNSRTISGQASLLYNTGCAGNPAKSHQGPKQDAIIFWASDREFDFLLERVASREYSAGEIVFSEGDPCAGLFVVESGSVRICKSSPGGRAQVLGIEGPGGSVAELPVFDGGNYPASVVAVEDPVFLFVSKQDFRALCVQSEGKKVAQGIEVMLPANNQELAAQVGTVRELVSRNLSRLEVEGIVSQLSGAISRVRGFGADLHQHVHPENNILLPRALKMEQRA